MMLRAAAAAAAAAGRAVVGAVVIGAVACGAVACGVTSAPEPRQADVVRIEQQFPGTTLAELERGRTIYLSRCTSCHAPVVPSSFSAQRWPLEVKEMSARAHLGSDEPLVIKYLVAQALRSEPPTQEK